MPRPQLRRAFALMDLLVAMALFATVMGLTVCSVHKIREHSTSVACQNNMRQIGQAIHHFHTNRGYFPPAQDGTGTSTGTTTSTSTSTWLQLMLPYIGYESAQAEDPVPIYLCPADRSADALIYQGPTNLAKAGEATTCHPGVRSSAASLLAAKNTPIKIGRYACTGYLAVVSSKNVNGPYDAVIYPASRTRMSDINDGQSGTILVGERPPSQDLTWGWWASPYKGDISMGASNLYRLAVRPAAASRTSDTAPQTCPAIPFYGPGSLSNPCDIQHFWSFHPNGGNWLFADGSVHFVRYSATLQVPKMATRSGGEVIDWLEVF